MKSYLASDIYDLISPDGYIKKINQISENTQEIDIHITNISPAFAGFEAKNHELSFNLKSTLAQLGFNSNTLFIDLCRPKKTADIRLELTAYGEVAKIMSSLLSEGMYIGKLFAAIERRKVREPYYLTRMFGRCDRNGLPLLSLGGPSGRDELILEKIDGYTIAFLPLKKGTVTYSDQIINFLPTLALMLNKKKYKLREILQLHQKWNENNLRITEKNKILLVNTVPLHIRTVFAKVSDKLLPTGFQHTSACVLQPDTTASGNIYELFGHSNEEIKEIPLEFYTLEPHREYVFFEDRDQLQSYIEKPEKLFNAFSTIPDKTDIPASVFLVKGTQFESLKDSDWITSDTLKHDFPGLNHPARQALLAEKYIENQSSYPFLKAIEEDLITSQGVLLTRYFPSPLMKRLLLSPNVQRCVKAIYFQQPSRSNDIYFSYEDRAFLIDLAKFGIPTYWVDTINKKILKYVIKQDKDTGMFVPIDLTKDFSNATFFGVYGSNLIEGTFEKELKKLLKGVMDMKNDLTHPLLNANTPLALVTGGGPGAMEVGNRVAKSLNILSCANIIDFRPKDGSVVNEQKTNPHIDAKMTYRLDKLVERQSEFNLDFPIFLPGGIGMDFEYTLEEVRRKTGATQITPILLFGEPKYWLEKISSRFKCNLKSGTIKGSEWTSNCFYCIQKASQGLEVYKKFFHGTLSIGKNGKIYEDGFCIVD